MIVTHAITLTEPWATLMAIEAKKNETRSRRTHWRGWVAIHASKNFPKECQALCADQPFCDVLGDGAVEIIKTTLGDVLAVALLVSCTSTEDATHPNATLRENERAFGDYSPGRWVYYMPHVRRLKVPMPARGFQSIPWKLQTPITEDMLA